MKRFVDWFSIDFIIYALITDWQYENSNGFHRTGLIARKLRLPEVKGHASSFRIKGRTSHRRAGMNGEAELSLFLSIALFQSLYRYSLLILHNVRGLYEETSIDKSIIYTLRVRLWLKEGELNSLCHYFPSLFMFPWRIRRASPTSPECALCEILRIHLYAYTCE